MQELLDSEEQSSVVTELANALKEAVFTWVMGVIMKEWTRTGKDGKQKVYVKPGIQKLHTPYTQKTNKHKTFFFSRGWMGISDLKTKDAEGE